ncbi:unnamed protein product (macronuclear) [Paramecium tetraurelia]|uniref:MORN repeat protein n=1 Tax=Paramecium tetraurelia TaxID=5888 RepID=A0DBS5_PARTE|nr:uncharacterized protein GSPATT00039388001 [Paramecium tetraurelia]CAK80492.1 unnamed protein product [Paramecium tetraurelia]|eukprot:XP_001447889.1 hypothetical protein (macronuclear) [Paramecium tetraurelia strain d4-2]
MSSRTKNNTDLLKEIPEIEVSKWDKLQQKRIKIKIEIIINSDDNLILYSYKGAILKKQQTKPNTFYNIEQIVCLDWQGEYGENNLKSGKWKAIWKGKQLKVDGGYYENGMKQGLWNELFKNYFCHSQVYEQGEYLNNKKVGKWQYFNLNDEIGGGSYDEGGIGIKVGKWIDLDEEFYNGKQVIFGGEYKNGKKVGLWSTWFNNGNGYKQMQKYDINLIMQNFLVVEDHMMKEVMEQRLVNGLIWMKSFILVNKQFGEENIKMVKKKVYGVFGSIMEMVTNKCKKYEIKCLIMRNFLVVEDHMMNSMVKKIGKWREMNENCTSLINSGEYKNNKQIGRWDIWFNYSENNKQIVLVVVDHTMKKVEELRLGNGLKQMKKHLVFQNNQVTLVNMQMVKNKVFGKVSGVKYICTLAIFYDQMGRMKNKSMSKNGTTLIGETKLGKKVGKWEIFSVKNQYFGGGFYAQGFKKGKWIETDQPNQITQIGEYKNGKKVGRWDMWKNYFNDSQPNLKIGDICFSGGGEYDEEGLGMKIGKWTLQEMKWRHDIRTYIGEYKNGNKVGVWRIYSEGNRLMFCVLYDLDGIEIDVSQQKDRVFERGQVQKGKKVGKWEIFGENWEQIGGGSYHEEGDGTKTGKWIEVNQTIIVSKKQNIFGEQKERNYLIYVGVYKNGRKVDRWESWLKEDEDILIGGGNYDEEGNGNKIGKWIDLDDQFLEGKYITQRGLYKSGIKVGRWDILFSDIHKNKDVQMQKNLINRYIF